MTEASNQSDMGEGVEGSSVVGLHTLEQVCKIAVRRIEPQLRLCSELHIRSHRFFDFEANLRLKRLVGSKEPLRISAHRQNPAGCANLRSSLSCAFVHYYSARAEYVPTVVVRDSLERMTRPRPCRHGRSRRRHGSAPPRRTSSCEKLVA